MDDEAEEEQAPPKTKRAAKTKGNAVAGPSKSASKAKSSEGEAGSSKAPTKKPVGRKPSAKKALSNEFVPSDDDEPTAPPSKTAGEKGKGKAPDVEPRRNRPKPGEFTRRVDPNSTTSMMYVPDEARDKVVDNPTSAQKVSHGQTSGNGEPVDVEMADASNVRPGRTSTGGVSSGPSAPTPEVRPGQTSGDGSVNGEYTLPGFSILRSAEV